MFKVDFFCFEIVLLRSRKRKSSLTNGTNGTSSGGDHVHRSDVIAVGTSSGSVLIYSLKTGDITAQFAADKAHSDRINDIVSDVPKSLKR